MNIIMMKIIIIIYSNNAHSRPQKIIFIKNNLELNLDNKIIMTDFEKSFGLVLKKFSESINKKLLFSKHKMECSKKNQIKNL